MRLVGWLQIVFLFLAGGILWINYGLDGFWAWSWIFLALPCLWLLARRWGFWIASSIGLALFLLAAALGLGFSYPAIWMVAAASLSLAAWDLSEFQRRLRGLAREKSMDALAYRHLVKLTLTLGLGALAAVGATYLQFQLSFWIVFLLGLGITLLLGWTFQRLLHSEDI